MNVHVSTCNVWLSLFIGDCFHFHLGHFEFPPGPAYAGEI